jgi:glycerol kinase
VVRPTIIETTALGAAYLAGLAVGYWGSVDELQQQWKQDRRFSSAMDEVTLSAYKNGWSRAVKASMAWADSNKN